MRQSKLAFSFNDEWSLTQGVELLERPVIPRAELRGTSVTIPGASGDVWIPDDSYNSIQFELKCRTRKNAVLSEISAWLTGLGDLCFPWMPDLCYRARLTADFQYKKFLPQAEIYEFTVKCNCQPFRYRAAQDIITLTKAGTLRNPGTHWSRPIITIYGAGKIVLTVGDRQMTLSNVSSSITINSEILEVYIGSTSLNANATGDFPHLPLGKTRISWTGSVDSVEVAPNWRWF